MSNPCSIKRQSHQIDISIEGTGREYKCTYVSPSGVINHLWAGVTGTDGSRVPPRWYTVVPSATSSSSVVSSSAPASPSGVCCSGWSGQGLQVVRVDVASSSTSGWWTGVSEEGSTLQCSGESAGGGGEEAAAGVRLPFPRPPPALPLPVFFRPPLPLGTSSVEGGGEEILSSKDLRRARGGSALPRPLPREPEVSLSISVKNLPRIKIK
jgi:hypothetical protein